MMLLSQHLCMLADSIFIEALHPHYHADACAHISFAVVPATRAHHMLHFMRIPIVLS